MSSQSHWFVNKNNIWDSRLSRRRRNIWWPCALFLWNVCNHVQEHMRSEHRRPQSTNNIWWKAQLTKLLIPQFSPHSLLGPNIVISFLCSDIINKRSFHRIREQVSRLAPILDPNNVISFLCSDTINQRSFLRIREQVSRLAPRSYRRKVRPVTDVLTSQYITVHNKE
jgi:hypothetical protein